MLLGTPDCYFRDRCAGIPPVDESHLRELVQQSGRPVTAAVLGGNEPETAMRSRWLLIGLGLFVAKLFLA